VDALTRDDPDVSNRHPQSCGVQQDEDHGEPKQSIPSMIGDEASDPPAIEPGQASEAYNLGRGYRLRGS